MSDWIEWNGGACPVPSDTLVDVKVEKKLDSGMSVIHLLGSQIANSLGWDHGACIRDIVAYRVVSRPVAEHDCTRSHPHEGMSKECELRTEIARLRNKVAQRPWVGLTDDEILEAAGIDAADT